MSANPDRYLMERTFRILIIEDDPDSSAILCDILRLDGHEVVEVATFEATKSVAGASEIELVIADRNLPEGAIDKFLPDIVSHFSNAEIIVVTGFSDLQGVITALRHGVSDYVLKPVMADDIRAIVNRIAEKKWMQKVIAEEHQFADDVLKTAEAIVLVLALDGTVIRFNPYFTHLTGWAMDELTGRDWFEFCVPAAERIRIKEVFISTARESQTRGIINDILGKDSRRHRIRWSNSTLKHSNGTAKAVLAVGVDVTDLAAAQTRALQSERLAAIGQTMTALAHESRNALQRMRAACDVLALEIQGNTGAEEDLRSIQRAGRDLEYLLEEVRSFAAPVKTRPKLASLSEIWQRAWDDIQPDREGRDACLIEPNPTLDMSVEVDVARMEQVFRNLFANSLDACTDPVRIELQLFGSAELIEVTCGDNGPGLEEEQRRRLFEPFYTTKQSGTGLGLSICQRILEAHHGTIEIEPSDVGTCFRIRLPRNGRSGPTMNYSQATVEYSEL